ncbi:MULTISPECIES: HDOD domain-containing protein [unclassified Colwellia]|uniref:HDOD domain-containing protein n=1 Tax=unclassified Colwellia TaxID=196834 RepID=UPI002175369B|nr:MULTISPECIES: HDOD domain-containing protein [unclassified Colwellia]
MIQECLRITLNIKRITSYFERDVGLSFKLFKFINSGILPISQEIKSALRYLGEAQTKKLILLLFAGSLATKAKIINSTRYY